MWANNNFMKLLLKMWVNLLLGGLGSSLLGFAVDGKDTRDQLLLLSKTLLGGSVSKKRLLDSSEILLLDGVISDDGLDAGVAKALGVEARNRLGEAILVGLGVLLIASGQTLVGILKILVHLIGGGQELLVPGIPLHVVNMRVDVEQRSHDGTSSNTGGSNGQDLVERSGTRLAGVGGTQVGLGEKVAHAVGNHDGVLESGAAAFLTLALALLAVGIVVLAKRLKLLSELRAQGTNLLATDSLAVRVLETLGLAERVNLLRQFQNLVVVFGQLV